MCLQFASGFWDNQGFPYVPTQQVIGTGIPKHPHTRRVDILDTGLLMNQDALQGAFDNAAVAFL
jgi:hypothetical protein